MNQYLFRTAEGRVCCDVSDVSSLCPKCKAFATGAHNERQLRASQTAPDPYAAALQKLRAAEAKPSSFEAQYKQQRIDAMIATRRALDEQQR